MKPLLLLALVAALGLSACGAAEDPEPVAATGEPEPVALPDVARIGCDAEGTRVETPEIKPQPDGVHLEIVNDADSELAFSVSGPDGGQGFGLPPGTTTEVLDIGPGRVTVACTDPNLEPGAGEPLEVVDEDGIWVSTQLACAEQFSQVADYIQGARGETSDPLEAARKAVEGYGLEPDDVFERAGHPESGLARVRLVRAGEPLAVVDLIDDGSGKWLVSIVTGCSSLES